MERQEEGSQYLLEQAARYHWLQNHQEADLVARDTSRIMVRGEGIYLYDIEGKRHIDAMAGLYLMNIGHGRTEIADVVAAQLRELAYVNSGAYTTVSAVELAVKLAEITPGDLRRVFFCGGGSEAVEIALKMARQYQYVSGKPKKTKIVARRGQYHGSTYGAMSLSSPARYRGIFEPHDPHVRHVGSPYCYRCPWGLEYAKGACGLQCAKDLQRLIEFEGAETIAAFIATPINAGNQVPPPEYWPMILEILEKNDILFIGDEVLCGFGRLGTWFGFDRFGVIPDIMVVAKALTGGYLPGGAVIASDQVAEAFRNDVFHHGVTYGSHPAVMVSGLRAIEIMEREGLVDHARQMGEYLHSRAQEVLYADHPTVGYVGSMGLLMAIEMVKDRGTREPWGKGWSHPYAEALTAKLRDRGLTIRAGNSIILSPPLTIDREEIDEIIAIIDECIGEMEADPPFGTDGGPEAEA